MIEYNIRDMWEDEDLVIYGYSWEDALRRAKLDNSKERYICWESEFID
jgi:hypothetical protein